MLFNTITLRDYEPPRSILLDSHTSPDWLSSTWQYLPAPTLLVAQISWQKEQKNTVSTPVSFCSCSRRWCMEFQTHRLYPTNHVSYTYIPLLKTCQKLSEVVVCHSCQPRFTHVDILLYLALDLNSLSSLRHCLTTAKFTIE